MNRRVTVDRTVGWRFRATRSRQSPPRVAELFWGADDFARARMRIGEVGEARQQGERTRLAALGAERLHPCGQVDERTGNQELEPFIASLVATHF